MYRAAILLAVTVVGLACDRDGGDVDRGNVDTALVRAVDALAASAASDVDTTATATAALRDGTGRELGTVTFRETRNGLSVSGTLRGLSAGGHGMHIHTTGKCEPTFEAAGTHWNPTNAQHGMLNPRGPHLGDLPNVVAGSDSTATVEGTAAGGTLRRTHSLLDGDGAALVIHARPDDYRTDPSGNSGDPIACGVISGR